jgi:hypothetical protein
MQRDLNKILMLFQDICKELEKKIKNFYAVLTLVLLAGFCGAF